MSELARRVGMSRDGLYKALAADGNPTWSAILKVTNALGLRFELHPASLMAPSIHSPGEFVAAIPRLLRFKPQESLVFVYSSRSDLDRAT